MGLYLDIKSPFQIMVVRQSNSQLGYNISNLFTVVKVYLMVNDINHYNEPTSLPVVTPY